MMKATALLAGLLVLGGCDPAPSEIAKGSDTGRAAPKLGEPYSILLAAQDEDVLLLIRSADGHEAAANIPAGAEGKLMDVEQAGLRLAQLAPGPIEGEKDISIKLPAFSLEVEGRERGGAQGVKLDEAGDGRVQIKIGSGTSTISIDASEAGENGAKLGIADQAIIRIDGADEAALRKFLNEQDRLSGKLRVALLSELGLE